MLDAADAVGERLSASSQRLESAAAGLSAAGTLHAAEAARLTKSTNRALVDYIERRASSATTQALAAHRQAMEDATTPAFAKELAPAVRDIARQIELHGSPARSRFGPLVAARVVGAVFGMGGAALWMRWVNPMDVSDTTARAGTRTSGHGCTCRSARRRR